MTLTEGPSGEWFKFDLSDLAAYQLPECNDWDFGHKHIDSTLNRRHMVLAVDAETRGINMKEVGAKG
jgi:hypothetical protein